MQIGDKVQLNAGEGHPPINAIVHAIHPLADHEPDDALHAIDALVMHEGHPADGTITYVHKENYSVVDGDHVAPREGEAGVGDEPKAAAAALPVVDLTAKNPVDITAKNPVDITAKNSVADAATAAAAAAAKGKTEKIGNFTTVTR